MAKVLAVVCARLNSSRLPGKQLLDLAGQSMIARIFQRLETIPELDHIVLATTSDDYNQPLVDWANIAGKDVYGFNGDVNDLVGRVDAVVEKYQPDLLLYVCGDSPLIEPSSISLMIQGLMTHSDADYTSLKPCPGKQETIHEGFSLYRYPVWKRTALESISDKEREHVGVSKNKFIETLQNLEINDDPVFCRLTHRISVDTPSDYHFMSEVYRRWYANNDAGTLVSLPWVIEQLEEDSALKSINVHVQQKAVSHKSVSILLVTQCGQEIGLGHLMRMVVFAHTLQDTLSAGVKLLVQGEVISHPELDLLPCRHIGKQENLMEAVEEELVEKTADAVIFDLAQSWVPDDMHTSLERLVKQGRVLVGIDGLFEYADVLDMIHVPSFYLSPEIINQIQSSKNKATISYGWESYLLPRRQRSTRWQQGNKVLVLTGGSDVKGLGKLWPTLLDERLPVTTEVHWVQGPYADTPTFPEHSNLNWVCHQSPDNMQLLMSGTNYVLTVHGVSFFEALQLGIPTVVLSPSMNCKDEMPALAEERVAIVADSPEEAVSALCDLMPDKARAQELSTIAQSKMNQSNAGVTLANVILKVLQP